MAALSKQALEAEEARFGLTDDGLSFQHRCSRIAAYQRGEPWTPPKNEEPRRGSIPTSRPKVLTPEEVLKQHPLYGKRLLITPMMTLDKNRALYFEEPIGPHVEVEEFSAGKALYGSPEEVDRMTGDYRIVRTDPSKIVVAKTTLPKSGQEISYRIGYDLVPVVVGNDKQRGYIWAFPTHLRQYGDTMIQLYGLKTLIQGVCPELLEKFSGKPMMTYIDGAVLAASIPMTDALLKEYRRKEQQHARLGFGD